MAQEVTIRIKVNDNFKDVTVDARSLGKAIDQVTDSSKGLSSSFVKFASISQIAEGAAAAIGQLHGVFKELTGAYEVQSVAETRLTQAMSNTMGATDEEVQAIKDLCSAQQQLGVIGDEVQLAAAQELATYLEYSDSLKAIIPVMNDMAAQQYGLGASAENVTQIATMLGKVMNGQTEALSRYGYKFDEAQKRILQYGTEAERAAVLVDVVGQSVGGMNEALAQTPVGKMKQMSNKLGDIKEELGRVAQSVMPVLSGFHALGQTATTATKLLTALRAIDIATLKAKVQSLGLAAAQKMQAMAQRLLAAAGYQAAAGTTALKAATVALYGALSLGLTVAIQAVIELLSRLFNRSKDAAAGIEEANEAQDAFKSAAANATAEISAEIVNLERLIKSKKNAGRAVADLNNKYGKIFGMHKTAAEWYDVLTKKSAVYAKQIGFEAQAKVLASQIAAKELEKEEKKNRMAELEKKAVYLIKKYGDDYYHSDQFKEDRKKWTALKGEVDAINKELEPLNVSFGACTKKMAEAADELGIVADGANDVDHKTRNLSDDLADYRKSIQAAIDKNRVFGNTSDEINVELSAMESGISSLITKYGLKNAAIQELIAEYQNLKSARQQAVMADNLNNSISPIKTPAKLTGQAVTRESILPPDNEYRQALLLYNNLKGQLSSSDIPFFDKEKIKAAIKTLNDEWHFDKFEEIIPESGLSKATNSISELSGAMRSLRGIVDETTASWLEWGANLLSVIGQVLPKLATLFTANAAVAQTEGAAAVASIPYVGPVMAVAAIASIAAAIASIPKFANGGIAYGPTLGLFGEYPGAANNPEVVAPLNRLREMIEPSSGFGQVEFKIDGYALKGILKKVNRLDYRNNG